MLPFVLVFFLRSSPPPRVLLGLVIVSGCSPELEVFSLPGNTSIDTTPARTDRVDLLLVVDNSPSMADKQTALALTVPAIVEGLTNPACVDSDGEFVARRAPSESCPPGSQRAFPAVQDLHVGVISSSIGGHGSDSCNSISPNFDPRMEDMGHLLTLDEHGQTVPTYADAGFLDWDPGQVKIPAGESDPDALTDRFVRIVDGVGQTGCGFEATLEAWYRFLVDPAPYERVAPAPCSESDITLACREPQGVDPVVLRQRDDFLRKDSVVAIVMLSDENDCSVKDSGQNFLALQTVDGSSKFHLAPGTTACQSDPFSPDCLSCWQVQVSEHPECNGWENAELQDPHSLRCFDQKRRFGIDFLYPVDRYVHALTQKTLPNGSINPLFCRTPTTNGAGCTERTRDPSLIVLMGIVGIPWQDIARDPHDLSQGYLSWQDVPWDEVLSDPLMQESVEPRSGVNPSTGSALATEETPPGTPGANPINGFERPIPARDDLQYACIFDLPEPIDCESTTGLVCDCLGAATNPVCWDTENASFGTLQYRGKAYPGLRHLEVIRGIGEGGVVASICPSNLVDAEARDFGYRPAVDSLLRRLRLNLAAGEEPR